MLNFNNRKTKKIIASIIVIIVALAMVLGIVVPSMM